MVAAAVREGLELVDLGSCRVRVLAGAGAFDVRFSADGRWLAYQRAPGDVPSGPLGFTTSAPLVVSVRGGAARSPLSAGVAAWAWARRGEVLCGLTPNGALVATSPTGTPARASACAGAPLLGLSPAGGEVVVNRSRCGPKGVGELDMIDLRTGARRVVVRQSRWQPLLFAGFSPDGRWLLFWPDQLCSSSIAADGMPLEAVPARGGRPVVAVRHMLPFSDFLSWCGRRLIAAAGPDRETQAGSALVQTAPPVWRQRPIDPARRLSWVSPACAPSGRALAAAAGPDNAPVGFGRQHRSIWLLRPDGQVIRRLTSPPAGLSDEAPRFSGHGRWVMFVRTRIIAVGQSAISRDTIELERTDGAGKAIPILAFTSNDFSYYDHFDWPEEIAWFS